MEKAETELNIYILQVNQKYFKEGLTPFFFYGRAIVKKITFEKVLTNLI